ncbi:amidohydrolase family protein [Psychrosphaera haliotis]|uniref:Amidohydrolase family protein n=1 Tax=Psychrosphaera haliotis TaxID=555083 RepID=A0A6N8F8T3_9GAMM|nr:hypothetical protein [Psychrosphaera haliotis]MUH71262.1 hypothetical protein [Psychrosphaera haliotis]
MTLINKNIMVWVMVILPFILFSSLASASQPEVMPVNDKEMVAFTNANILDPSLELPITDSTILVSKGKVLKIQPNSTPIPYGVKKVDLKGKWVLPGLIDGHVHLAQSGGAFTRPDIVDARKILSYEDEQDFLFKNREKILSTYIRLGITSILI